MIKHISVCVATLVLSAGVVLADGGASSAERAQALRLRRGELLDAKDFDGLKKLAEEVEAGNPDARLRSFREIVLGDLAEHAGQSPAEIFVHYEKAVELDPSYAFAQSVKGFGLLKLERLEEALVCLKRAEELNPKNKGTHRIEGYVLCGLGRFKEGLAAYDKELAIYPDDVPTWLARGVALMELSRLQEAVVCFDTFLAKQPEVEEVWYYKARACAQLGRLEEVIKCCDHLMKGSLAGYASTEKAVALCKLNRHAEALPCFDRAIEVEPQNSTLYSNKALALTQMGRDEEAVGYYERASALSPDEPGYYYGKGEALHRLGRYKEAKACVEKGFKLRPEDRPPPQGVMSFFWHIGRACENGWTWVWSLGRSKK